MNWTAGGFLSDMAAEGFMVSYIMQGIMRSKAAQISSFFIDIFRAVLATNRLRLAVKLPRFDGGCSVTSLCRISFVEFMRKFYFSEVLLTVGLPSQFYIIRKCIVFRD